MTNSSEFRGLIWFIIITDIAILIGPLLPYFMEGSHLYYLDWSNPFMTLLGLGADVFWDPRIEYILSQIMLMIIVGCSLSISARQLRSDEISTDNLSRDTAVSALTFLITALIAVGTTLKHWDCCSIEDTIGCIENCPGNIFEILGAYLLIMAIANQIGKRILHVRLR